MDDRFLLYTLDNWLFHKDFTGNIIDNENLDHMKDQCKQRLGEVHLITADGSIDCTDTPECQEETVGLLHFAEIITALEILGEGGSFVVKMFTLFDASSMSKLYLLNCVFKEVHVFKPCTSKRGNSEVYVICLNYQKNNETLKEMLPKLREKLNCDNNLMLPMFPKSCMPSNFIMQHEIMCRLFMTCQIQAIESNIFSFEIKSSKANIKNLQALRTFVCDEYFTRYKVKTIPEELKILYKYHANIEKGKKTRIYHGSHSEREMLKETTQEEQIFLLQKQLNEVKKYLNEVLSMGDELKYEFKRSDSKSAVKITLYRGQPLAVLHSTLFVSVNLLVIRAKLNEFHPTDVVWHNNPHVLFPQENIRLDFNDFASSPAHFSQQQESFFKAFFENLLKYKPNIVKFVDMAFLSHYATSILRYLSRNSYEHLNFSFHPTFEIVLEKPSPEFHGTAEELNAALCSSSNHDILCFINMLELHHNEFNKTLTSYNNMLLLQKFISILDR